MSDEDIERVFSHLDKSKTGFLTYNEFCGILTDKYKKQTPARPADAPDALPEDIEQKIQANLKRQNEENLRRKE